MKEFKYTLEKYTGRSTRHECPACHQQQVFARYVDEAGNYIADNVGRCNRSDRCGYHLTPKQYFADKGISYTPTVHVAPKPLTPTDYIPEEMMIRSLKADNHLLTFLISKFGLKAVSGIMDTYYIGDGKGGRVIYWQVDDKGLVRTGKIMLYDPLTGKRVKDQPGAFDWVHRHVKQPYQLEQCLFGLHLINKTDKPIGLVESEKSAIIASLAIPDCTWVATGGKQNFRLMEVLKGREVILFPDLGAFNDWQGHADKYVLQISNLLEGIATPKDRENGLDIADYILREILSKSFTYKVLNL